MPLCACMVMIGNLLISKGKVTEKLTKTKWRVDWSIGSATVILDDGLAVLVLVCNLLMNHQLNFVISFF